MNLLEKASGLINSNVRKCEKALEQDEIAREEARQKFEMQRSQMQEFTALKL